MAWWIERGENRPEKKRGEGKRRGITTWDDAAPLWMISVSHTPGYGKFTQTNDSHLPEAKDTIEKDEGRK